MTPPEPGKAQGLVPKTLKALGKPIKDHLVAQHEEINNQKMLAEKHNEEKLAITLLIVGTGFWVDCLLFLVVLNVFGLDIKIKT